MTKFLILIIVLVTLYTSVYSQTQNPNEKTPQVETQKPEYLYFGLLEKNGFEVMTGIFSILGVVFGGYIVRVQLKKGNEIAKSQILNSVYQRLDEINRLTFENPKIQKRLQNNYNPELDRYCKVNSYVDMLKTFFYEIYYHNKKKLLDEEEWKSWEGTIINYLTLPYVRGYWQANKVDYGFEFQKYIDRLIGVIETRLQTPLPS